MSAVVVAVLLLQVAEQLAGQGGTTPLTLLSRDQRRSIPTATFNGREFVALDDLASTFQLPVLDEAGAITVSYRGRTIVLTPEQTLASVAGRLISLPAAPARIGGRWMVPTEFISRALAPVYDTRLDLRPGSHLLIMGDLRVPRVTIRYETLGSAAVRVTFDATPQTTSTVTQDASRVTIKFDADAVDALIPPIAVGPVPIVLALRALDPSTLAIDLGPRFIGFRAATLNVDASTRLVVDLAGPAPMETAAPASPPPPAPSGDLPVFGQPVAVIRTIVIDPGHGGDDPGSRGAEGTQEKDVTLAVARRLKATLEGRLGARVLLTRDDDRLVALDDRTAVANNNKADLFLSLHANASLRPAVTGASIYVAAFSEGDRAEAALTPTRVPIFGGGVRDIEIVPWDLAQIRHVVQSTELARILQRELETRVPVDLRPVDYAPFRVLESANMPAALIELGYLTNPDQERQLAGGEFQSLLVQGIAEAVLRFRDFLAGNGADR